MTENGFCVIQKLRGTKALWLGRRVHPSPTGKLDDRLTLCHAKVEGT